MITEEQFVEMMVKIYHWFSLNLDEDRLRFHLREIYWEYLEDEIQAE